VCVWPQPPSAEKTKDLVGGKLRWLDHRRAAAPPNRQALRRGPLLGPDGTYPVTLTLRDNTTPAYLEGACSDAPMRAVDPGMTGARHPRSRSTSSARWRRPWSILNSSTPMAHRSGRCSDRTTEEK